MGIHDRDYYRESARGMFESWGRWSATTWLIIISVAAYTLQVLTLGHRGEASPILEYGIYDFNLVRGGEVWRLISPIFVGMGVFGVAFNMLTLYWAGSRLEDRYGSREFVVFFFAAGLIGYGSLFLVQLAGVLPPSIAFGPSPVIIAILVVFACHYPHEKILLFFVPVPAWLLAAGYVAFALLGSADTPVPFSAYLGGAAFGFAYYWFELHLSSLWPGWPTRARRTVQPKLRVVRPEELNERDDLDPVEASREPEERSGDAAEEPLELTVDRVLEKVSRFGQGSLTPAEREVLFRASEVYKRRRQ